MVECKEIRKIQVEESKGTREASRGGGGGGGVLAYQRRKGRNRDRKGGKEEKGRR